MRTLFRVLLTPRASSWRRPSRPRGSRRRSRRPTTIASPATATPTLKRDNGTPVAVDAPALRGLDARPDGVRGLPRGSRDARRLSPPRHARRRSTAPAVTTTSAATYHDSIHAQGAREVRASIVAPACADCHGTPRHPRQDRPDEPRVRTRRCRRPAARCHDGDHAQLRRRRPRRGAEEGRRARAGLRRLPHGARDPAGRHRRVAPGRDRRVRHRATRRSPSAFTPHVPRQGDAARLRPRGRVRRLPRRARHPARRRTRRRRCRRRNLVGDVRQVPPGRQRELRAVRPAPEPARLHSAAPCSGGRTASTGC